MKRRYPIVAAALLLAIPLFLLAQGRSRRFSPEELPPNPPYDGRITYARIRYAAPGLEFGFQGRDPKWDHDYPRSDRHFPKILEELTSIRVRPDLSAILTLDDPELMKYPFAYICETGYWRPNDAEVLGLRNYLLKGGFLIVDDFEGNQWYNTEAQFRRVLPEARLIPLTPGMPVFDSFYHITSLTYNHPVYGVPASFFGIFEDNDPTKRLLVVVNYNFDVSEYWEFSDEGYYAVDLTNEAYKLGVNYVIYTLSH
ncbi:MAG: DUF4159 domain-containing protein [Gemmatimonadales bacterium]|nr:DUF4159 domain-containing protein [Gemmatimonadales bacterium]